MTPVPKFRSELGSRTGQIVEGMFIENTRMILGFSLRPLCRKLRKQFDLSFKDHPSTILIYYPASQFVTNG